MQFLVLFRRKWPLTLLYRPPFILKLETPTFFGHHFFISFFLFHFPVHFIVFIVYSILPFSFLLFSHTKKDQVHKREKKKSASRFVSAKVKSSEQRRETMQEKAMGVRSPAGAQPGSAKTSELTKAGALNRRQAQSLTFFFLFCTWSSFL